MTIDFKQDIQRSLDSLDYLNDPDTYDKQEELRAMDICADALIRFAERHAEVARELARREKDPRRKRELVRIAEVCSHVPTHRIPCACRLATRYSRVVIPTRRA